MNNYFKKFHKFRPGTGVLQSRQKLKYGSFAFVSLGSFFFKKNQIEACKKAIARILKLENKIIEKKISILSNKKDFFCACKFNLFPNFAMSEKPREVRMGKGKGAIAYNYFPVKKGRVILELKNVDKIIALKCFNEVFSKIPQPIRLISVKY